MKNVRKNIIGILMVLVFSLLAYVHVTNVLERREIEKISMDEDILMLSSRVDLVAYTPYEELYDGDDDDEADIYYSGNTEGHYFTVEEFTQYDPQASDETIIKIRTKHIPELNKVRDAIGKVIVIRSAARSYEHEKEVVGQGTVNTYLTED